MNSMMKEEMLLGLEPSNSTEDRASGHHLVNFTNWMNSTPTTQSSDTPAPKYVALLIVPIIIAVAMGNILVIVAVSLDRKLRSATNCFLTSLAFADLLVALTVMPPSLAMIVNNYVWPFSDAVCGVWVMLDVFFSTSSILHLCMISLDRYMALARPLRHSHSFAGGGRRSGGFQFPIPTQSKKFKRVATRTFAVWAIALGISMPLPILGKINRSNTFVEEMCVINIAEFQIVGSFLAFFLPLIIMFVMYLLTIQTLREQARMVSSMLVNNCKHSHRRRSSHARRSNQSAGQFNGDCGSCVYTARQFQRSESTVQTEESAQESTTEYTTKSVLLNRQSSKKSQKSQNSENCDANLEKAVENNRSWKVIAVRPIAKVLDQVHTLARIGGFQMKRKGSSTPSETTDYQQCSCRKTKGENKNIEKENQRKESGHLSDQKSNVFSRKYRSSVRRVSSSLKTKAMASITNEQRASKVLGLIFILFCLFWCPFFITNVVSRLCSTCDQASMGEFMNWFVWIGYVSSGVNPVVYTMFSRRFRETFSLLLRRKFSEINQHKFKRSFSSYETSGASIRSATGTAFRSSSKNLFQPASSHVPSGTKATSSPESSEEEEEIWMRNVKSAKSLKLTSRKDSSEVHAKNSTESPAKRRWRSSWHANSSDNNSMKNNSNKPRLNKSISAQEMGERTSRPCSDVAVNYAIERREQSFKFQPAIDEKGELDHRISFSSDKTWLRENEDYSSEDMTSSNESVWSNNSSKSFASSEASAGKHSSQAEVLTNNNTKVQYTMTVLASQKNDDSDHSSNNKDDNTKNSENIAL